MKKVTKVSEMISYLKWIKAEYGDVTVTLNFATWGENDEEEQDEHGDDTVYIDIIERDKNEDDLDLDEQETVASIQNYNN